MKKVVLCLTAIALLAGFLALQQSGTGRAQEGPESRDLGDTSPVWSPTGELIAFVSTRDLKPEIYVMKADGTAQRRLTTSPPGMGSSMPAWSPDGRLIAFVTGTLLGASQISVINADGSDSKLLVSGQKNTDPVWSPDGQKIAFALYRAGRNGVYVIAVEGGEPINISAELPSSTRFSWSPDGKRLAFAMSDVKPGASHADGDCGTFSISTLIMHVECRVYIADVDGRKSAAAELGGSPAWSPDGSHIAFVSTRGGTPQIHVMGPNGSGRVQLTSQGENFNPVWSPDGRHIAFLSERGGQPQVFVMNADGSGQLRVSGSRRGDGPSWSPDGQRIVYASRRAVLWQLYSVNTDGTGETMLTEGR